MNMTNEQIQSLLEMLALTKDSESNCDECLKRMSEFAEATLSGKSIPATLKCIDDHLQICGECREEFEALKTALEGESNLP